MIISNIIIIYLIAQVSLLFFQKTKRNLYTAGTGITTLIAAFIFTVISHLPMVAIKYWIPITTSIQVNIFLVSIHGFFICQKKFQGFMMDLMAFSTHAVVSPCVIFWASSEARKPAIDHCYLAIWYFNKIRSNLIDTIFKRICRKVKPDKRN